MLSGSEQHWLEQNPEIILGVYTGGWRPYEAWNGDAPEGLGPEYLREAAAKLGVRIVPRPFDSWAELLATACDGQVDLIMNVSITAERTECLIFTQSYTQTLVAVVGRLDDPRPARSPELTGLRVVTERGFATSEGARSRYPDAIHLQVDTTELALDAVASGAADVYVGNAYVASEAIRARGLKGIGLIHKSDLSLGTLHFAVPNANRPLAEALNVALQAISDDRRDAIEARWLPELTWANQDAIPLSASEQLALRDVLPLGVPPQMAPLFFRGDDGNSIGLLAEYLARFRRLGARFSERPSESWRQARATMRADQVDVAITVADPSGPPPGWIHSHTIVSVPNVVVISAGTKESVIALRDLAGKTIAVADPERLVPLIIPSVRGATFVESADARDGLERVRRGEADAYVGNLAVVDTLIREEFAGALRISAPVEIEDRFVLAARAPHAQVVAAFDRMLASIPQREREAIRGDWWSFQYTREVDWPRIVRWTVPVLLVLLCILLIQARSNRRLRMEMEARRELESRFAEVTSHLPAVIYQTTRSIDGEYAFPYVAGDLKALFGISNEEATGCAEKLLARVHPDDRPWLLAAVERVMDDVEPLDIEFRALSDRGWRWIRSASRPYSYEGGRRYWTGYWIDVTDQYNQRKDLLAAKSAAEDATRAKANFLATMSHEIRTPMSGVIGLLEMLTHTPLDGEQRKIVGTIGESAQMLRQILDDILDFSKLEAGALPLESSPLSLRGIVDSVVRILAPLSASKGLQLEHRIDFRIADFHLGDEVRLRQVLFNLVSNAIKFTEHGHVEIGIELQRASEDAQTIVLSVADTGIGISEERQPGIFRPFAQADASTTRRYGGTGLGLSISERIVTQMGGRISLRSQLGEGTTVSAEITLPVAAAHDEPPAEHAPELPPPGSMADLAGRILIAEDHPTNRTLMAWYMQQLGLAFDIVENGRQALHALECGHYDLLITDCLMPVLSGYELASEVRRRERESGGARLPILAITANVYRSEVERCRAAGMDAYLAKPVSLDSIGTALRSLLGERDPSARPKASEGPAPAPAPGDLIGQIGERYGSRAVALAMLAGLQDSTRADIEQLRQLPADASADHAALLHRLAGALGTIGQTTLAEQAKGLEHRFLDAPRPRAEDMDAFLGSLERLLDEIAAALASQRPG